MRILFVNPIQMFGGGEVWMLRTLTAMRARGHAVHLLCRPDTELARRAQAVQIPLFTFPIRGDFGPLTILRTRRLLKKLAIDVVLANMDKELRFAGLAGRLAGGVAVIPRRGVDYPLKNQIHYRWSYNQLAHRVVANSQATKNALLRNAPWLDPNRVEVIYNGLDPQPFLTPRRLDMRRQWGLAADTPLIGFVGQLDERKGVHTLLSAFAGMKDRNHDAHLVMVGEGPLRPMILEFGRSHHLDDRIHLLGFRDDIEEIMKNITLLVLPSLWEGFGIVLLEAMAAAKPVVTTAVSSMPEIVLDRLTGRVVPVQDVDALMQAMEEILAHPDRAQLWGQNGRKRVQEHFTLEQMIDRYLRLFQEQIDLIHARR